jgi:transposase-like protein
MVRIGTLLDRLIQRSDIGDGDGCWEWKYHRDGHGYGTLSFRGRALRAHRAMWEVARGEVPFGLFVCHHCDNRRCVRPTHLFLGTHDDNMADKIRKGRQVRGTQLPQAVLDELRVREICEEYQRTGVFTDELAARHGVGRSAIRQILNGKTWKHVTSGIPVRPAVPQFKCSGRRLSPQDKEDIRALAGAGMSYRKLAARFGVTDYIAKRVALIQHPGAAI